MAVIESVLRRIPGFFFGTLACLILASAMALALSLPFGLATLDPNSFRPIFSGKPAITDSYHIDIAIVYGASVCVVLAIASLLTRWSDEDFLTPLRKKLVGEWSVATVYRDADGHDQQYLSSATISLDNIQKLCIAFHLNRENNFAETTVEVYDVALNPRQDPNTLMYHVSINRLRLSDSAIVITRYFVMLEIMQSGKGVPQTMQGTWHELTGATPKAGNVVFKRK